MHEVLSDIAAYVSATRRRPQFVTAAEFKESREILEAEFALETVGVSARDGVVKEWRQTKPLHGGKVIECVSDKRLCRMRMNFPTVFLTWSTSFPNSGLALGTCVTLCRVIPLPKSLIVRSTLFGSIARLYSGLLCEGGVCP